MISDGSRTTWILMFSMLSAVAACDDGADETEGNDDLQEETDDTESDAGGADDDTGTAPADDSDDPATEPTDDEASETDDVDAAVDDTAAETEPSEAGAPSMQGDGGIDGGPNTDPGDGGMPAADGGDAEVEPEVTLSNVPLELLPPSPEGDLRIAGECEIDSETGEFYCDEEGSFSFAVVEPEGGSRLGVMRVNSLQVDMGGILRVSGALPLVIVANDTLRVFGRITASALKHEQFAGGFAPANGPGAGQEGVFWPSSGGSYCGVGGDASAPEGESPTLAGGTTYGNETLIPLLGGSGGGSENGGAGGGALQLVAASEIQIGITGVVDAGGGGGRNGGGGGGSGGSLLLEAPSVTIEGVLAANGGGGGASVGGSGGSDATPNANPALGEGASNGGEGSAGDEANGAAGVYVNNNDVPGGGGGAGRIRINTLDGTAAITGTLSPSEVTGCATLGELL
jgi:hypothetical protein